MHARMEEEYRLALSSADQERHRLEETIASLRAQLADERRAQAIRYFVHVRIIEHAASVCPTASQLPILQQILPPFSAGSHRQQTT